MKQSQQPQLQDQVDTAIHHRRRTLTLSGGNKGGCGKSLIATTLTSLLIQQGETVTVIEADQANPDLARRFRVHVDVLLADIRDRDGWIAILDALETIDTRHIVMSLPAGMNEMEMIGSLLNRTLKSLEIELNYIFVLSRQHDSLELIGKSIQSGVGVFAQRGLAIKNGFFGTNNQFDRWAQSAYRQQWLAKPDYSEAYLPELNFRIVDLLESYPQPLHLLSEGLTTALRFDLMDWLKAAEHCLAPLLTLDEVANREVVA